ncbi:hypothetical protein DH2020_026839 [Rehmannia glutinosa]|uniref:X8 domain-containing protein n=1 Tax=Rehmannia glutinosa TaxID=99300 RepID=A0ABR0VZJ7_REHGL
MANNILPIFLFSFILSVALCSCSGDPTLRGKKYLDGWCVVNTGAPPDQLQAFLDYGCNEVDCSPILPGGACYEPNVLLAHSSWILDKFYREGGFCKEGLGYITPINPCKLYIVSLL